MECTRPDRPLPIDTSPYRTILALLLALPLTAQATTVWTASSTEKIQPSAAARVTSSAALTAARNEFEAFQLAVVGPATGVSASATAFAGPAQLPAARLFREGLVALANQSGPDGATGTFPDALIPDVDDVVGERRNAFPFDVPAGETRVIWVEVHVPADAAPGDYQASVVVRAAGQPDAVVPVTLTVWNFALPSTSSLKSHFGLYYGDLIAAHGVSGDAFSTLRARYAQLGLDHRISLGGVDDGVAGLDHFSQFYGALVDGTAPTQLSGAKLTSVQFMGSRTTADYATWASYFKARGWFDRLFDYTCDEPPSFCAWSDIPARSALIKAADPAFRTLVTTTVQDAQAQGVLSSIDILTPVLNWMDDKADGTYPGPQRAQYDAFLAQGAPKELWMYQSCMSHGCGGTSEYFRGWATYAVDAAAVRNRAMEWLSFQFGVTGELYYESTQSYTTADPWNDLWAYGGNGDGSLFYPGTASAIGGQTDIPLASLRLKMIREGMEDFEYLKLLSDSGDPALAHQLAASLFPDPWTQPALSDLLAARETIAQRILALTAAPSPAPGATTPGTTTPGTTTPGASTPGTTDPGASSSSSGQPTAEPASTPVSGTFTGSGCSAGAGTELLAGLGLLAAMAARRRRARRG